MPFKRGAVPPYFANMPPLLSKTTPTVPRLISRFSMIRDHQSYQNDDWDDKTHQIMMYSTAHMKGKRYTRVSHRRPVGFPYLTHV